MHWALVGRPGVVSSMKEVLRRMAGSAVAWAAVVKGAMRLQRSERGCPIVAWAAVSAGVWGKGRGLRWLGLPFPSQ